MLMNITVQTFKTENELELSVSRWDAVKDQFMPRFREAGVGVTRRVRIRTWAGLLVLLAREAARLAGTDARQPAHRDWRLARHYRRCERSRRLTSQ